MHEMSQRFRQGWWHDGIGWHSLRLGRAISQETLVLPKDKVKFKRRNKQTQLTVVKQFTQEHAGVLETWSKIITGFWNIREFIHYMSTHPWACILEFRVDDVLIGFDWLIELDEFIIHQLFPWRKDEYGPLGLGSYAVMASVDHWPHKIHLFGEDGNFKRQFGGWTYESAV